MSEIDALLSRYVQKYIVEDLGPDMMKKIKHRLHEKGFTVSESIKMFYPFDETLREFFGNGTDGMLQTIFSHIYELKRTKNTIVIKDPEFSNLILETYGNKEKKSILQTLNNSYMSISEILDKAKIPQSSGYKTINSLIEDGFLSPTNTKIKNPGGNLASTYGLTISFIDIKIHNSSLEITLKFNEENIKKSRILALSFSKKKC